MRLIGLVVDLLGTRKVVCDQKVNVGVGVCRVGTDLDQKVHVVGHGRMGLKWRGNENH